MAELRESCGDLGWSGVRTYIQSGNIVFTSKSAREQMEAELERAIEERFDLRVAVIVRTREEWAAYLNGNPFPAAAEDEPNRVMLALSKAPPKPDALAALRERAIGGERVELVGDALWIHFLNGAGRSKLSPGLLDRLVGSPVTLRNCRTLLEVNELMADDRGNASV